MPNAIAAAAAAATIQTPTLLSITLTTEATAATARAALAAITTTTLMAPHIMANNNIKAYESLKPVPEPLAMAMAMAMNATTTADDDDATSTTDDAAAAPFDFTLKVNKAAKAAASHHVAATATSIATTNTIITSSKANITTIYIKRNRQTNNMTTRQSKSERNGNENILGNNPTAAFMASTIAITTSAPTAALAAITTATDFQHKLFGKSKAAATTITPSQPHTTTDFMFTASSSSASSFSSPFDDVLSSSTQLPANFSNMSFHQHCLNSRDSFADLITIVLYTIVCVIGLFGNTLVIYVVLRFSKMQTVTNIYILNLAIADECFLIGIPFLLYTMRICSWTFGEFMCKAYMVSTSITQFTSSIFLLIMSADRFIAVCHPIASPRYRTLHIAKYVSALAWLTSAVLMLPVILFASTVAQEDGLHYSCNIEWPERYKKHSGTTFILYTFFLGFATPLCFILCFYYLVIKKLHAVGRKHKSKEKKRSHRKVTRLVLTVITVYIMCWLPQWISQVALISSNPAQRDLSRFEVLIFLLIGCLAYSNSAMNPILYAFLSDNFRKSFSKAFTCMAGHEVNAQLQVEPSVFTKHGGSRRRSSKRLVAQATPKTKVTLHANPTLGNNNSSTTTSSTATQNERNAIAVTSSIGMGVSMSAGGTTSTTTTTHATSTGNSSSVTMPSFHAATTNGRLSADANVMLVLDKEESVCATVIERRNSRHFSGGGGGNTLQTDL